MDPDPFQTEVAQVALAAAGTHGFALGGGHALIAHGVVRRQTEDVDLFTDRDSGVVAASAAVEQALTEAGITFELIPEIGELSEVFGGFEQDMREYEVSRTGHMTRLTLARFDRLNDPVTMDIGPVLHIDDVAGSKMMTRSSKAFTGSMRLKWVNFERLSPIGRGREQRGGDSRTFRRDRGQASGSVTSA